MPPTVFDGWEQSPKNIKRRLEKGDDIELVPQPGFASAEMLLRIGLGVDHTEKDLTRAYRTAPAEVQLRCADAHKLWAEQEYLKQALSGCDYISRSVFCRGLDVDADITLREIVNGVFTDALGRAEGNVPSASIWMDVLRRYPRVALVEIAALVGAPLAAKRPEIAVPYLACAMASACARDVIDRLVAVAALGLVDDFDATGRWKTEQELVDTLVGVMCLFQRGDWEEGREINVVRSAMAQWDFSDHW